MVSQSAAARRASSARTPSWRSGWITSSVAAIARARARGGGELAPLEALDQGIEGAVEHLGEVAGGQRVAEQLLGVAQLLLGGPSDRDLQQEPFGRHRCQLRARVNLRRRKFTVTRPGTLRPAGLLDLRRRKLRVPCGR